MLSFLSAPKGVLKRINHFRARLLWQEHQGKKTYHLVNWPAVCMPKDCGGMGILDLDIMNQCLLCKWLWKMENSHGSWQEMLSRKYLQRQVLSENKRIAGESHFWQSVSPIFQQYTKRIVGDGAKTQFWEDIWTGTQPLAVRYPRLYNITFSKHKAVKQVKDEGLDSICFRRTLYEETAAQLDETKIFWDSFEFSEELDGMRWLTWFLWAIFYKIFISSIESYESGRIQIHLAAENPSKNQDFSLACAEK